MQTSDSDQRLAKGTIVGPYEIIRLLGKGGMGEVYEAYEAKLFRKVALKIISEEVRHNRIALDHFLSEGRTLAQLNHPNVVTIYQLGEDKDIQFIAMEYIEGDSLDHLIETKPPSIPEAIFIFYKILNGVLALHSKGIIHRDLKPKNIMVPDMKTVKIVDFGIAEFIVTNPASKEKNSVPKGSIYYLAPEILEGKPATIQSDIWGLGVIFYNLLTGLKPFRGQDKAEIRQRIINGKISFPMSKKLGIPENLVTIINKMCAVDLQQRYKTIDEIIVDLKKKQTPKKQSSFLISIFSIASSLIIFLALAAYWNSLSLNKKVVTAKLESIELKEIKVEDLTVKQMPEVAKVEVQKEPTKELPTLSVIEEPTDAIPDQIKMGVEPVQIQPEKKESPKLVFAPKPPKLITTKAKWTLSFKKNVKSRSIATYEYQQNHNQKLMWKKVLEASSYRIQISEDINFKKLIVDQEISQNEYAWDKIKVGDFYWRVQSKSKENKKSIFSSIGNLSVRVPPPIFKTGNQKIKFDFSKNNNEVVIQWLGMESINWYKVRVTSIKGEPVSTEMVSKNTEVRIPIKKSTRFKAQVMALDDKRLPASAESNELLVDVESAVSLAAPKLVFPLNKTVVPSQSTMITPIVCKWSSFARAKKYIYQISEDKNSRKVLSEMSVTENRVILTLPLSKGEYFWRVKLIDKDDVESSWSLPFSFIID